MKHFVKSETPVATFQIWLKKNQHAKWDDFSRSDAYRELKDRLIEEQQYFCCYCEESLKERDTHIEHFKPRSSFPKDEFKIRNLFACCVNTDSCGHKKQGKTNKIISPLDHNCQTRFTYTGNGKIISKRENDTIAQQTIDLLGLNCERLRDHRENIIKIWDMDFVDAGLLRQYLDNCVDWCSGFFTVFEYIAEKKGIVL
jgi:uncharacterized protein (TIGR02646 family)